LEDHVRQVLGVSERRACAVIGQPRTTQRREGRTPEDEAALVADMIELARQYGRYGYRRITALLRSAGWEVNKKRVKRLWRREGLKVPARQPPRNRLWLNERPQAVLLAGPATRSPSAGCLARSSNRGI
jgi:transposase InsO family protein